MIKIKIPRWLWLPVWFGVVVPCLLIWEVLWEGWKFMAGDDERPSRWEWVSVALIAVVAAGTLGSMRGWWA